MLDALLHVLSHVERGLVFWDTEFVTSDVCDDLLGQVKCRGQRHLRVVVDVVLDRVTFLDDPIHVLPLLLVQILHLHHALELVLQEVGQHLAKQVRLVDVVRELLGSLSLRASVIIVAWQTPVELIHPLAVLEGSNAPFTFFNFL